ncbi:MAG TPA: hypothetical protein VK591_04960 [Xanthobacteraceae bacterium]|nr:hypothetical protein [Xanthobacteraceae bacterium]
MIGFFFRYLFSIPKLNCEPEQHELAQLFIDYADSRKPWQAIFEFLEAREWPRDVRELRITHALSLVKVHRRDVYPEASWLGRLIIMGARQGVYADAFRAVSQSMAKQESSR